MAVIGFRAKASINDGESDAQQDIASLVTVTFPSPEAGEVEVTPLFQADFYRRFIPTLIDGGTVTVECYWTKALYSRILLLLRASKTMLLTSPDEDGVTATLTPQTLTVTGFVKKVSAPRMAKDEAVVFSFDFRLSGVPTYGSGTNDS